MSDEMSANFALQGGGRRTQVLVYKYRVKDKHARELDRQASAVNYVWNYCNETQQKSARVG